MTAAFNLSQLANKVNTSGQLDISTGVSGVTPVANGGTGLSSAGSSGNFLTSNGSAWASTAPPISSTAQAQAGTDNSTFISPLRLREGLNASGSAPIYSCRAWVSFNGSTGGINASGNVSSVTRNGTGDFTVNFTTAMPDANYVYAGTADPPAVLLYPRDNQTARSTTSFRIATVATNFNGADGPRTNVAVFR